MVVVPITRTSPGNGAPSATGRDPTSRLDEAVGLARAIDLKIARGDWGRGPCAAWIRMRYPLVPGREPSPLERVLTASVPA